MYLHKYWRSLCSIAPNSYTVLFSQAPTSLSGLEHTYILNSGSTSVSGLVAIGRLWLDLMYLSRHLHDLAVLSVNQDWCVHAVVEAQAVSPCEKYVAHKAQ